MLVNIVPSFLTIVVKFCSGLHQPGVSIEWKGKALNGSIYLLLGKVSRYHMVLSFSEPKRMARISFQVILQTIYFKVTLSIVSITHMPHYKILPPG